MGDMGRSGGVGGGAFGGRRVDDAIVGVTGNGVAVVVKPAPVGIVGEVVFEELRLGGRVLAKWAFFARAVGESGMRTAAAEAAAEGTRVAALVLGVGVRINGVFVRRVGGRVRGAGTLITLEHRFSGTEESGSWGRRWRGKGWRRWGQRIGR